MKKTLFISLLLLPALWLTAQTDKIPEVKLRDLNGQIISSSQILTPDTPTLLVLWNTSDSKFKEGLEFFNEMWDENLRMEGVNMVAICTDNLGSWSQVKPLINGNGWDFDAYIDVNGDFMRAMNVGAGPYALLIDKQQNILYRYSYYYPVNEDITNVGIASLISRLATASNKLSER